MQIGDLLLIVDYGSNHVFCVVSLFFSDFLQESLMRSASGIILERSSLFNLSPPSGELSCNIIFKSIHLFIVLVGGAETVSELVQLVKEIFRTGYGSE